MFSPTNVADSAAYRGPDALFRSISDDESDDDGSVFPGGDAGAESDHTVAQRLLAVNYDSCDGWLGPAASVMSHSYASYFRSAQNTVPTELRVGLTSMILQLTYGAAGIDPAAF